MKKVFWFLLIVVFATSVNAQILGSGFKLPAGQHNLTLGSSYQTAFTRYKYASSRRVDINLAIANNLKGKGITCYTAGLGFQLFEVQGEQLSAQSDSDSGKTPTIANHWNEVACGLHFAVSGKVQDTPPKNAFSIPSIWFLGFRIPAIKLFTDYYLKSTFNVGIGQTLRFEKLRGTFDCLPISTTLKFSSPSWLDIRLEHDLRQKVFSGGISLTLGKPRVSPPTKKQSFDTI